MPAVGLGTVAVAVRRLAYRCGGSSGLSARTVLDELASGATGFPFQSPDCAGDHLERGHLNSVRPQRRQRGVRPAARGLSRPGRRQRESRATPTRRRPGPRPDPRRFRTSPIPTRRRARRCWSRCTPARGSPDRISICAISGRRPVPQSRVRRIFLLAPAPSPHPAPAPRPPGSALALAVAPSRRRKRGDYHFLITCVSRFLAASLTRLL